MEPRCWFSPCKLQYIVEPKHQCKQASRIDCNTALSQFFWKWEAPKSHHTKHKGEWVDKEVKYQIPSLWLSLPTMDWGNLCSWWLLPLAKEIGSNWLTLPAKKSIVSGISGRWNMWTHMGQSLVGTKGFTITLGSHIMDHFIQSISHWINDKRRTEHLKLSLSENRVPQKIRPLKIAQNGVNSF